MMILMLLIEMPNAVVKTKITEGKISGTLSMMTRFTQDQPIQEEAEEQEATVAAREEDSIGTLEMNTTRGRHQPVIMEPDTLEEGIMIMKDINVPEVLTDTKQEEKEEVVVEEEEYPQSSIIQEDHPIICQ